MVREGVGSACGRHRGGSAHLDDRDRAEPVRPGAALDQRTPDFPVFVQPTTARAPATTDSSATEEEYRMSPQHPTPDANAEAAATRAGETGLPPTPAAPDEPTPSQAPTPAAASAPDAETANTGASGNTAAETGAAGANSGTTGAGEPTAPAAGETAATTTTSGTGTDTDTGTGETAATVTTPATGTGEATATGSEEATASAAAGTTEAPEERVAVAAAVATPPPGTKTDTGVGSGRPRKPILAGAAIAGAALIAIPLLLTGSAKDDGPPDSAKGLAAEGSDTVLNPTSAPAALDDYVAEKPSPSPKKAKATKSAPAKVTAPQPVVPAPESSPSSKPETKPKAKPKPKPKATPQPNWSTETVFATSVLEVNQAWTTNRIRMVMQTDGNLVVYNEHGNPIWASMTFGSNHRAIFQPDGNLVIHNGEDRPIWASQTWGHEGAQLVLRADAKVVIVQNGAVLWST
ncbi:mannose-binding protein [Streptomyces chartreusis]|uniref:mannose-binding protein n=1 Tax=Streptomyces chartreusis TaxID=1969 RepID=UPI00341AEA5B